MDTYKNCELILYNDSTSLDKLEESLTWEKLDKWAWIEHNKDIGKDGKPLKPHRHVMLQFVRTQTQDAIAKNFGIEVRQIEKIKGRWADALDYLTHANAKKKFQYKSEEVHSNFDWETVARTSTNRDNKRLEQLILDIASGEVRQYNLTEHVDPDFYVRNKVKISRAFDYRDSAVKSRSEQMGLDKNVLWVYGNAGTGKTAFAKYFAQEEKLRYSLTSTGQHMFDEYMDEPALIIDDLRPEDLKMSDLLGILDPFNFRAAAARYKNKPLQTELVIVTTILSPSEYAAKFREEDSLQLFRRISSLYQMTQDQCFQYKFDFGTADFQLLASFPNTIKLELDKIRKEHDNKSVAESIFSRSFEAVV